MLAARARVFKILNPMSIMIRVASVWRYSMVKHRMCYDAHAGFVFSSLRIHRLTHGFLFAHLVACDLIVAMDSWDVYFFEYVL